MAYSDQLTALADETLVATIKQAIKKNATAIVGEAGTGTIIQKRHDLGVVVLRNNMQIINAMVDTTVASLDGATALPSPTDGEIDTAIAAVWNDHAGVMDEDS